MNSKRGRYAAMLLFQFRIEYENKSNKKRICEERIIHLNDLSPDAALQHSIKIGEKEQFDYDDNGRHVYFEFIGVKELIELSQTMDDNEVWSIFKEKLMPMERKDKLIPPANKLNVFNASKAKLKI